MNFITSRFWSVLELDWVLRLTFIFKFNSILFHIGQDVLNNHEIENSRLLGFDNSKFLKLVTLYDILLNILFFEMCYYFALKRRCRRELKFDM